MQKHNSIWHKQSLKQLWRLVHVLLIVIACENRVLAQQADHNNAAYWYQLAGDQLATVPDEWWERLADFSEDPTAEPDPIVGQLIARTAEARRIADRGASKAYCDQYIDRSDPSFVATPHAVSITRLAMLTRVASRHSMIDGNVTMAVNSIRTSYSIAHHLSDDHVDGSVSASFGMLRAADADFQSIVDSGNLSPEFANKMLPTFKQFGTNDPLNVVESISLGSQAFLDHVKRSYEDGQFAGLQSYYKSFKQTDPLDFENMAPDEFDSLLDKAADVSQRVAEALRINDPKASQSETQKILNEIKGTTVEKLMPVMTTWASMKPMMVKSEQIIRDRIVLCEKIISGELSDDDTANAAVWYLRGIAILNELTDEELVQALIADRGKMREGALDDDLKKRIEEALALFVEGSHKRRCDFSIAKDGGMVAGHRVQTLPSYVGGMHVGISLLLVQHAMSIEDRDFSDALDRLATTIRIMAHLCSDGRIPSSFATHTHFRDVMKKAMALDAMSPIQQVDGRQLHSAMAGFKSADPFGYGHACRTTSQDLVAMLRSLLASKGVAFDEDVMAESLTNREADVILFVASVVDEFVSSFAAQPQGGIAIPIVDCHSRYPAKLRSWLGDAMFPSVVDEACFMSTVFAPDLSVGNWKIVTDWPLQSSDIQGLRSSARTDFREAVRLVAAWAKVETRN